MDESVTLWVITESGTFVLLLSYYTLLPLVWLFFYFVIGDEIFIPYEKEYLNRYCNEDEQGKYFWDTFARSTGKGKQYPIIAPDGTSIEFDENGKQIRWLWSKDTFDKKKKTEIRIIKLNDRWSVQFKQRLNSKGKKIRSLLTDKGTTSSGNDELKDIFNNDIFSNPKPSSLIQYLIVNDANYILDFFGGSGTTAHAVINLNREDGGSRKFTLVEMNDYFDSIILPRVKKVSFSSEWKNGQAQNKNGYSGIFQYIELEQYDDIIDNLEVVDGVDYSKIDFGYIYEPDKNQINFRMENELKDPLSKDAKFDLFASLLFHEGLELINLQLNDNMLEAGVKDKYGKECMVVLGKDKAKVEDRVKALKDEKEVKIYTNQNIGGVEHILAETFKGK